MEFHVRDKLFFKVFPTKGVVRFELHGKLNTRYVGLFELLQKIRKIVYRLALPLVIYGMHDVFHVSMLRKYVHDKSHLIDYHSLDSRQNLSFNEALVKILDKKNKSIKASNYSICESSMETSY